MKKNAFTLIELISILTLLGLIAVITVPIMSNTINKSKDKSLKEQENIIEKAAKKYALDIPNLLPSYNEDKIAVSINDLKENSYLENEKILNPKTNKEMKGCVEITYSALNNKYKYLYKETCENYAIGPKVDDKMIPIVFRNNKWVTAGTSTWFNYKNKEWANTVIVTEETFEKYKKAETEIEVLDADIIAHLVWIPRFSYTIQAKNTGGSKTYGFNSTNINSPGSINIKFTKLDDQENGVGYYFGDIVTNYKTHDAFFKNTNNNKLIEKNEQLSGIWVGKFETTADQTSPCYLTSNQANCQDVNPFIKPDSYSLKNQNFKTQTDTALKLSKNNNLSYESKQMKNNEWGAVTYLSQSIYGRCTSSTNCPAITKNTDVNMKTGQGNYKANLGQSTTNNITGIFDMSGGLQERTSSFLNKDMTNTGFFELPNETYFDNYTNQLDNLACVNDICYGHALTETKNWLGSGSTFLTPLENSLVRGGLYNVNTSNIFTYKPLTPTASADCGFRISMSVK
ncbi:MAG: type II secretion system protein [Bacilli bacterium]